MKKPEPRFAYTVVPFKYQFPAGNDRCMCILRRSMQHHSYLPKLTMPSRQEAEHNHPHLSHKGYQPANTKTLSYIALVYYMKLANTNYVNVDLLQHFCSSGSNKEVQ